MKMGTAWDGIYRRKILRTGIMSDLWMLSGLPVALPKSGH